VITDLPHTVLKGRTLENTIFENAGKKRVDTTKLGSKKETDRTTLLLGNEGEAP